MSKFTARKFTARTFTGALLAATILAPALAAPAMAQPGKPTQSHAQQPNHGNQGGNQGHATPAKKPSQTPHRFKKGEKFDRNRASNYQTVDYRKYRNVKAPPKGYHYVRSGNDLLLVGITSGIIAAVTMNMFH
jgi:Ni/Co efflux regulator RcnB